jgi:hypothetical protein
MPSIFPPPVRNYAVLEVQGLLEQATKLKARALELGEWVWEDIVEALGLKIVRKKKRGRQKGAVNKKDADKRALLMNRYEVETQKLPATDVKISKRLSQGSRLLPAVRNQRHSHNTRRQNTTKDTQC